MRVAVSQASSLSWSFERDLECYARLGVEAVSLLPTKVDSVGVRRARAALDRAGMQVAGYGTCGYFSLHERDQLPMELDVVREHLARAGDLGAETLTLVSGSGGGRPYPQSEAAFRHVIEELLPAAERAGVAMVFENTGPMRVDICFVHTFHDALDFAEMVDSPWFKVCLELNNAWMERFLYEDIATRTGRIGLVQINDFPEGSRTTPDRVPLGDGVIPLDRIFDALVASRYSSYYEIEQVGPQIERLGYEEALQRSLRYLARRATSTSEGDG